MPKRDASQTAAPALRGKLIALVGAGNMGRALLAGMVSRGVPPVRLRIVEARPPVAADIARRLKVRAVALSSASAEADVLLLAVKPQDLPPVLAAIRLVISRRARKPLIISIAAGLQLDALQRALGPCPLVRVMPNLPAKVACGISVLAAGRSANRQHRALARAIFQCVGQTVELPERRFDAVTAISGSGPAYVFLFIKALRDAGVKLGLPADVAEQLAMQTALGSVRLAESEQQPLEALISQVASKRGTTEAALQVFGRWGFERIVGVAAAAAARRSRELSALLSKSN